MKQRNEHKPEISLVVPVYNGSATVVRLFEVLRATLDPHLPDWELLFVDDGSHDSSGQVIRELIEADGRVKLIVLSRNFGQQAATSAGIDHARGRAVVILDQDLQDPPAVILDFVRHWREGYDVVYGIRTNRKESWLRKASYHAFYRVLRIFSDFPIPVDSGDFCLMDRRIVNIMRRLPERTRFIRGMRAWAGFKQKGVPYERAARTEGESEYTLAKYFQLAADGLVSFSMAPLRLASFLGFVLFVLSMIYSAWVVMFWAIWGVPVRGFPALVILVAVIGGWQLLTLGIAGEYLGRIFNEVRQRPFYVVEEIVDGGTGQDAESEL
jgi:glycosyltransferase involved in cell wall biosynthesis